MSASAELQKLIVLTLRGDTDVKAIIADRVETSQPTKPVYPYVSIGPSNTVPDDAQCIAGINESIQLDCWSRNQGNNIECKKLVSAVRHALHFAGDPDEILSPATLKDMRVVRTMVQEDFDGITYHGVVSVEARIWENYNG